MDERIARFVSTYDFPQERVLKYKKLEQMVAFSPVVIVLGIFVSALLADSYLPLQVGELEIPTAAAWIILASLVLLCIALVRMKQRTPIKGYELVYHELCEAYKAHEKEDWNDFHKHIDGASSEIDSAREEFSKTERELLKTYSYEWSSQNRDEDYLQAIFENMLVEIVNLEASRRSLETTIADIESNDPNDVEVRFHHLIFESLSDLPVNRHTAAGIGVVIIGLWMTVFGLNGYVGVATLLLGIIQINQNKEE